MEALLGQFASASVLQSGL